MHVIFVCLGNICRSPMAERVAKKWAATAGIPAQFTSAGISNEEAGNPIDRRARSVLSEAGCDTANHQAHKITAAEIQAADLVVALEPYHLERMQQLVPGATNLRLLTDFDPAAEAGSGVPDPWYGGITGFYDTLTSIEAAMPEIMDFCRTGVLPPAR